MDACSKSPTLDQHFPQVVMTLHALYKVGQKTTPFSLQ